MSDRKKVLYLYDNLPAYRKDFFELLSHKLARKGMDFVLGFGQNDNLTHSSRQLDDIPFAAVPLPIRRRGVLGLFTIETLGGMMGLLKRERPDVIVLQFHVAVLSYWFMYLYAKMHGIPYITWDCNYTRDTLKSFVVKVRKWLVDFTYMQAAACITYGTVFRDYLLGIGKDASRIVVAQNTINTAKIIERSDPRCLERTFEGELRLLYVGALIKRKYVLSAVKAVKQLLDDGLSLRFDIVGNGDAFDEIQQYVKDNGLEQRVLLHGAKHGDEVKAFFESSDVFILPGTGGLAINEAMCYSMPVISTVGDDTVVDLIDGNGFLLKNFGDTAEIKEAIRRFAALSADEKRAMACRSRSIVMTRATLDNMASQHVSAIERVL